MSSSVSGYPEWVILLVTFVILLQINFQRIFAKEYLVEENDFMFLEWHQLVA